ncbi:MAG TPA: FdhF/YdeP family oxidoreductase [Polyangiales bacterium]|nr:FdhF/YdeP family oxidoreductase [Polyangiales bacterium]
MRKNQPTPAEPPEKDDNLRIDAPKTKAAGLASVRSAFAHMFRQGHSVPSAVRVLGQMNQTDGFDCPGCAWPDPDDRASLTEFCENGAKAAAWETTRRHLDWKFFQQYSIDDLAKQSDYWLGQQGRFTQPLMLRPGSRFYEPIDYEEAFQRIGNALQNLGSPHEAIFYTSGRTSNEAAFLYQLFVRAFGTNNLPDCSNMCHESSGVGLGETVGIGKGSVTLDDIHDADTIIVMGQNPGTNHPRMLTALQKAKKNGAMIIAINPLPEAGLMGFINPKSPAQLLSGGTSIADLFLQVQINGDVALLKAMMCLMLKAESEAPGTVLDEDFIGLHTEGFEALRAHLQAQDVDALIDASGVSREALEQAVSIVLRSRKTIVCWAMGLTQHKNGVGNVREIVNFLLMRGSIGIPGAGTCPVRGHSNVQGDRTMGIHDRPSEAFLDRVQSVFGFDPPREHGFNTVEAIQAMLEGRAKVFFAMGGNFLQATPDTQRTARALQRCEMLVHVSTKLNRSHLLHNKWTIILPCLGRSEIDQQAYGPQFVTVENSMGVVHSSQGHLKPAHPDLYSEPSIVTRIAQEVLGPDFPVSWCWLIENYDRIRDLIAQTIPGFEDFNARVRRPGGFHLYNGARERKFHTDTGKAKFTINEAPDLDLPEGTFRMMTMRTHDQYNTTVYGNDDRYRGIKGGRRVVFVNEIDMREAGLSAGTLVDLTNDHGGRLRIAPRFTVVPYPIPRRCVGTYFPEANVLVPLERYADGSFTPASKDVVVRLAPSP